MATRRDTWGRREFLGGMAGTVGLLSIERRAGAEPPPETTAIRLIYDPESPAICYAPQYVAEELLRGEGFSDVQYAKMVEGSEVKTLVAGRADMSAAFAADLIIAIDQGNPVIVLTGLHVGCMELFGTDRVKTIRDLRGKTVAVSELGSADHIFVSTLLAYVGLDPRKDIKWAVHSPRDAVQLLTDGKIDAFIAFPPFTQELRAKKVGHVVVRTATDRPWSENFCCMLSANRDWVRRNPVATKRAVRAILKASQICATEPERAARVLVDRNFTPRYDYAVETLKELPYLRWREYDPASTLRFHALRLRDVGIIKKTPQQILAQGTDWRFLTELKKELKG
jgi:NitT/TauT family transport system substrate-binding protein